MKPPADPLAFAAEELAELEAAGLLRVLRRLRSPQEPMVEVDGQWLLAFASNNYLGLANHPEVVGAVMRAADTWGASSSSARLVVGHTELHEELEAELAALVGSEDAVLFSSGYMANLALASLVNPGDAVFSDELNHASIIDACRLSSAGVHVYRHKDSQHLGELLAAWRKSRPKARAMVVTDAVFSMEGDLAPLDEIVPLCERYEAILMVDEAHATGVIGPGGRGAVAHFGLEGRVPLIMSSLGKALGSAGGFLAGSQSLCDFLRNKARTFIFDTALPPTSAAAALAALGILRAKPGLPDLVRALARQLAEGLEDLPFPVKMPVAGIVPIMVGDPDKAVELSAFLLERGLLVPAIRPPSVAKGTARLRATVSASHPKEQVRFLVQVLRQYP